MLVVGGARAVRVGEQRQREEVAGLGDAEGFLELVLEDLHGAGRVGAGLIDRGRELVGELDEIFDADVRHRNRLLEEAERLELPEEVDERLQARDDVVEREVGLVEGDQIVGDGEAHVGPFHRVRERVAETRDVKHDRMGWVDGEAGERWSDAYEQLDIAAVVDGVLRGVEAELGDRSVGVARCEMHRRDAAESGEKDAVSVGYGLDLAVQRGGGQRCVDVGDEVGRRRIVERGRLGDRDGLGAAAVDRQVERGVGGEAAVGRREVFRRPDLVGAGKAWRIEHRVDVAEAVEELGERDLAVGGRGAGILQREAQGGVDHRGAFQLDTQEPDVGRGLETIVEVAVPVLVSGLGAPEMEADARAHVLEEEAVGRRKAGDVAAFDDPVGRLPLLGIRAHDPEPGGGAAIVGGPHLERAAAGAAVRQVDAGLAVVERRSDLAAGLRAD